VRGNEDVFVLQVYGGVPKSEFLAGVYVFDFAKVLQLVTRREVVNRDAHIVHNNHVLLLNKLQLNCCPVRIKNKRWLFLEEADVLVLFCLIAVATFDQEFGLQFRFDLNKTFVAVNGHQGQFFGACWQQFP